jgi:hypothetical protein
MQLKKTTAEVLVLAKKKCMYIYAEVDTRQVSIWNKYTWRRQQQKQNKKTQPRGLKLWVAWTPTII